MNIRKGIIDWQQGLAWPQMTPAELNAVFDAIDHLPDPPDGCKPLPIVEIGVWQAETTRCIAEYLKASGKPHRVIGIDPFDGFVPPSGSMTGVGHEDISRAQVAHLDNVDIIKGVSWDVMEALHGAAMVLVDGCHSRDATSKDIELSRLKSQGPVLVHDRQMTNVQLGAADAGCWLRPVADTLAVAEPRAGYVVAYDRWRGGNAWSWLQLTAQEMGALRDTGASHILIDLYWDLTEKPIGYDWTYYDPYVWCVKEAGLPLVARAPVGCPDTATSIFAPNDITWIEPRYSDWRNRDNCDRLVAWLRAAHKLFGFNAYLVDVSAPFVAVLARTMLPSGKTGLESAQEGSLELPNLFETYVAWLDLCVRTAGECAGEVWLAHELPVDGQPSCWLSATLLALLSPRIREWTQKYRVINVFPRPVGDALVPFHTNRHLAGWEKIIIGNGIAVEAPMGAEDAAQQNLDGILVWAKYGVFEPHIHPGGLQCFSRAAATTHAAVAGRAKCIP